MNQSRFDKILLLNNRGIAYLEADMHDQAAAYFKKASQLAIAPNEVSNLPSVELSSTGDSTAGEQCDPPASSSLPARPREASMPLNKEGNAGSQSPPRPTQEQASPQSPSESRKRQRAVCAFKASDTSTMQESTQLVIGRPFWLTDDSRLKASMLSLSSVLLYNLALNYHLQALLDPRSDKANLKRAMGIYEMSQKLAWKAPGPVLLLSLHNMSQIHHYRGNEAQGALMSRELCKILRVLHVGIDGYEKFYLKMLSLQSRNLAAAA